MTTIIWDWNGTLLDDLELCISTINVLLKNRNLNLLDKTTYKEVFSFPVKDYYESVGFDFQKEDFSIPAREFIDLYNSNVKECKLHHSASDLLGFFKNNGIQQFVLSAMKQNMLEQTLKHNSIEKYFTDVFGLNDHYAASKIERGLQLIAKYNIDKRSTWMIGDTIHDFEVAESLGINCILIADGHQSEERLQNTGVVVIPELKELKNLEYFQWIKQPG